MGRLDKTMSTLRRAAQLALAARDAESYNEIYKLTVELLQAKRMLEEASSMDTLAETMIFHLRRSAGLFLAAGNTEEFARIQNTIGHLQELYGVVKGAERKKHNDRTA